jgi:hypothetical protein
MPELISRMEAMDEVLRREGDEKRYFHGLYMRNTQTLWTHWQQGLFVDPDWFQRWDVVFANLYMTALGRWRGNQPLTSPWQRAFETSSDPVLPPLRHMLVQLCVHLNYDLPRAMLRVMPDEEFTTPEKLRLRQEDYAKIDDVLTSRVTVEDHKLKAQEQPGDRPALAVLLTPFNRLGASRFLMECRQKIWRNAVLLNRARQQGPEALQERVRQLDGLTRAKIEEILVPGQVLLRLALRGYGVSLPDAPGGRG